MGCYCTGFMECMNKVLSDYGPYSFVPDANQPKLDSYTTHCGWSFKCTSWTCPLGGCTADDQPVSELLHTAYVATVDECDGDPSQ